MESTANIEARETRPLDAIQSVSTMSRWEEFRYTMGNALVITRREVRDSFRDWRIVAPIVILTFLFPFLAQFVAARFSDFVTSYGADLIGERTIPFLLMIVGFFPISISLVIALETFVGEKERRSLEPLLSTPLTNTELYIGKTLAAMIPPLVSSYGGMLVYLGSLLLGELAWRPPVMLIIQIMLLTTVQALVMVTGAVVVSSQANSTRAANLLASFIIIPMSLVIQGESAIMFIAPDADSPNGIAALWAIIVGMFLVCVLLLRVGNSIFNREELLGSTVDSLNLKAFVGKLWRHFCAVDAEGTPARNIVEWYRYGVMGGLRRTRTSIYITGGVFLLAAVVGFGFGMLEQYRLTLPPEEEFIETVTSFGGFLTMSLQSEGMVFIFVQNSRVLLATLILATFSFGVVALILPPVTFAILGYLFGQIMLAGYTPLFILSAVFTHGIIEIPVILLATAVALRVGAVVTKPPQGETVGHAWTVTVGEAAKLIVALIIPGLMLAAFLEAFVTPRMVLWVLGL